MRDFIRAAINGRVVTIAGAAVFTPLSEILRRDHNLTGTKVVCAEGDCGSCTVLLGKPVDERLRYTPVCSCILYGGQLEGCHVITVEGLGRPADLHPVQKAMVEHHGAQCGYCTPGFVVAMTSLLDDGPATDRSLRDGLVGNLCRCTGYEPILKAGLNVDRADYRSIEQTYPSDRLIAHLCPTGSKSEPRTEDTPAVSGSSAEDRLLREYPPCAALSDDIQVRHGDWTFFRPTTIDAAIRFRVQHPNCLILSGGTDLGVQLNKSMRPMTDVLSLAGISSLTTYSVDGRITIGAATPLSTLESITSNTIPELSRYLGWFGSPQIRNAGTIGGNLGTGSPIGDTLPPLMVLEAEVELTGPAGSRVVNINDFYAGYRKTVAATDELITAVSIPIPRSTDRLAFYKVSKRKDLDISTVSAAIRLTMDGDTIAQTWIAIGGVAATVVRLKSVEAMLTGQNPTAELFDAAADAVTNTVKPLTDVRGSAEYRSAVAANLLRKFYAERFEDIKPQMQTDGHR